MQWLCDGRRLALNVDNTVKIFDALHHRWVAAPCLLRRADACFFSEKVKKQL